MSAAAIAPFPYTYHTPEGYGDTFYIYAYDADNLQTGGVNYYNQKIVISDGDFLVRYWSGFTTSVPVAEQIQIRDRLRNQWFSDFLQIQANIPNPTAAYMGNTGWPVMPEYWYPDSGYIGFDLLNVLPLGVPLGQLAFMGVRRRKGFRSDPQPSLYSPWYEKEYSFSTQVVIKSGTTSAQTTLVTVPITDYDFELRRIDGWMTGGIATTWMGLDTGYFKILLLDSNKLQVSNVPLLLSNLFHVPSPAAVLNNSGAAPVPKNFWPCPPMLYPVNSSINFNLYVTAAKSPLAGTQTMDITFRGVRRYPCQ